MKIKKSTRKKIFINLIVSLLLTILVVSCFYNPSLKDKINEKNYITRKIDITDLMQKGYSFNNGQYISLENDPNFTLNDINGEIKTLKLDFKEISADTDVAVYIDNGNGFNPDDVLMQITTKKDSGNTLLFDLSSWGKINSLRLDVGSKENEKFSINGVSFEKNIVSSKDVLSTQFSEVNFIRSFIFFFIFFFIGLHFIFDIKTMYCFIFRKRYILTIVIYAFLVISQFNFSSTGVYNDIIQPNTGSTLSEPIFGNYRTIRSDEFIVTTPAKLSKQYDDNMYSKYNSTLMGSKIEDGGITMITPDIGILNQPFNIGYLLFGSQYGYSMDYFGRIIGAFLIAIEFFMIVTKKNKLLSALGAFLIAFSSYVFWWNISWIFPLLGFLVCIYHFINIDNLNIKKRKDVKKLLLSLGAGICAASFVCILYPAWQVPGAYFILAVILWIILNNLEKIKAFNKKDIVFIISGICLFLTITGVYLFDILEYVEATMNTVYPGHRIDTGGNNFSKIYNYYLNPLLPFASSSFNQCETATFISLFPLPTIMALLIWWKKKDKKDILFILLILTAALSIYNIFGVPEIIAKITLLSFTTGFRNIDIISFIQVVMLIICLSRLSEKPFLGRSTSVLIASFSGLLMYHNTWNAYSEEFGSTQLIVMILFMSLIIYMILASSNKGRNKACLTLIIISIISTVTIHPLMKSFDAIYEKPLSKKITEISEKDPDAKWIGYDSLHLPGFMVASGASTYNYTNFYPNYDFWKEIDPDHEFEEAYNRYAHIGIVFVEDGKTNVKINQDDYITLYLNINEIDKLNADYICSLKELPKSNNYKSIYYEDGAYIYKILE